jgi:hypothetical protein
MLGIHKIWVHSKVRKQSIATRLIDAARTRMVFGTVVPAELVAFSSPTEAGAQFAVKYLLSQWQGCSATKKEAPVLLVYDLPL